jgi:hypothetical protein
LIDALLPVVSDVRMERDSGPLLTTFLVAMSTPIITLPIERVERHRGKEFEGLADERHLSREAARAVDDALGTRPVKMSPFFEPGIWRKASFPYTPGLNLVREIPEGFIRDLNDEAALDRAAEMSASQWASCLRNALSHGGVFYLDEGGRPIEGQPVRHIAFVSTKLAKDRRTPEALIAVRIAQKRYLAFLRNWVAWLEQAGLMSELAA